MRPARIAQLDWTHAAGHRNHGVGGGWSTRSWRSRTSTNGRSTASRRTAPSYLRVRSAPAPVTSAARGPARGSSSPTASASGATTRADLEHRGRTRSATPAPHDRRAAPPPRPARPCRAHAPARPARQQQSRDHRPTYRPPVIEARCAGESSKAGRAAGDGALRTATSPRADLLRRPRGDGGDVIVSGTDEKPKTTYALRRLRNIAEHSAATLLVDHYEEERERAWWVRADGRGRAIDDEAERERAVAATSQVSPVRAHRHSRRSARDRRRPVAGWAYLDD